MSEALLGYGQKPQPLLIVISGPSGVGKDSVLQGMKDRDLTFHFVVTANTRPKRADEVDGVDYDADVSPLVPINNLV